MTKIYSSAYKVLVWLSPPSEDSELALAQMKAMDAFFYIMLKYTKGKNDEDVRQRELQSPLCKIFKNPLQPPKELLEPWEAIIRFAKNSWFTRAWIVQEVSSFNSYVTPLGNVEIIMCSCLQTVSLRSTVM